MCKGMADVINSYNARLGNHRDDVIHVIAEDYKRFQAGDISPEQLTEVCHRLKEPSKGKATLVWARRFKKRFMWAERRISAPSPDMPYQHEKQVEWCKR